VARCGRRHSRGPVGGAAASRQRPPVPPAGRRRPPGACRWWWPRCACSPTAGQTRGAGPSCCRWVGALHVMHRLRSAPWRLPCWHASAGCPSSARGAAAAPHPSSTPAAQGLRDCQAELRAQGLELLVGVEGLNIALPQGFSCGEEEEEEGGGEQAVWRLPAWAWATAGALLARVLRLAPPLLTAAPAASPPPKVTGRAWTAAGASCSAGPAGRRCCGWPLARRWWWRRTCRCRQTPSGWRRWRSSCRRGAACGQWTPRAWCRCSV
jgi:hypothetical protein